MLSCGTTAPDSSMCRVRLGRDGLPRVQSDQKIRTLQGLGNVTSWFLRACAVAGALFSVFSYAAAKTPQPPGDPEIRRAVGFCGDPCTIRFSTGGSIADYEDAADAIMAGVRQRLVIDGLCASACMVMADRARAQTCITARAKPTRLNCMETKSASARMRTAMAPTRVPQH